MDPVEKQEQAHCDGCQWKSYGQENGNDENMGECVLTTRYSPKSPPHHNLAFIEEGMLVSISYYDEDGYGNNVELSDLRTLSFDKVELKPM